MIEAMWSVKFGNVSNGDYGAGIIVVENGLIRGGDSTYYYKGSYKIKDDNLTAEVDIVHYFGPKNNIFGPLSKATVIVTGKIV